MRSFLLKIKENWKKTALWSGLFLIVLAGLFYAANLDLSPKNKSANQTPIVTVNISDELKKRMAGIDVSMESYDIWARKFGLDASNSGLDADPDLDGLLNYQEYIYGTNPLKADTDGDGYSDRQEIVAGYDPSGAEGNPKIATTVSVSKINVSAPMVWSGTSNENEMLSDLENGVAHFAQTAAPGQTGNMIISGHSSNYVWAKGNYNHIFKDLNNLEVGDVIDIQSTLLNGRVNPFHLNYYKLYNLFQ
jgi:hypothetical protein